MAKAQTTKPKAESKQSKAQNTPRLKQVYNETIRKALQEQFGYDNEMQVPRIDKIVLNMGVGEATADSKKPSIAAEDLAIAAGLLPSPGKSRLVRPTRDRSDELPLRFRR